MPQPIYFEAIKPEEEPKEGEESKEENKDEKPKEPVHINDTPALWLKQPKDCTDEEYKEFYKKVFHVYDEPLFYVAPERGLSLQPQGHPVLSQAHQRFWHPRGRDQAVLRSGVRGR